MAHFSPQIASISKTVRRVLGLELLPKSILHVIFGFVYWIPTVCGLEEGGDRMRRRGRTITGGKTGMPRIREAMGRTTLVRLPDPDGRVKQVGHAAYEAVKRGRVQQLWHWVRNKMVGAWRYDVKPELTSKVGWGLAGFNASMLAVSTGVGVTGVVVSVAYPPAAPIAAISCGGIALLLTFGKFTVNKLVKTVAGFSRFRTNADWLKKHEKAEKQQSRDWAIALSSHASDAVRRAVDHFAKAENLAQNLKIRKGREIETCNDVIQRVRLFADFIHESDKCRNYLLPIFDLIILTLIDYIEFSKTWNSTERVVYENAVNHWVYQEDHSRCKNICFYGYFFGSDSQSDKGTIRLEADDVLKFATDMAKEMEKAMRGHLSGKAQARGKAAAQFGQASEKRKNMLYDAVYTRADKIKALHKATNYWSRTTRKEKFFDGFNMSLEGISLAGSVAGTGLGMATGGLNLAGQTAAASGTKVVKYALKAALAGIKGVGALGGFIADKAADKLVVPKLSRDGELVLESFVARDTPANLKDEGVAAGDLIKKLADHLNKAVAAHEEMRKTFNGKIVIDSCDTALGIGAKVYEFLHYMDKMEVDLIQLLAFANLMAEKSLLWANAEAMSWVELDAAVTQWVANPLVHDACRASHSHCYGAKRMQHTVRTGFMHLHKSMVQDGFDHWQPEKPM